MNASARSRQIRQIKAAGAAMFDGDEAAVRDVYEQLTGKRFVRIMTDAELCKVGDYLARATGHKPDRRVALRPGASVGLAARLAKYSCLPPPGDWRTNPLHTRGFWARLGVGEPRPFEHLDAADQDTLHRACVAQWGRLEERGKPAPARAPARCANTPAGPPE